MTDGANITEMQKFLERVNKLEEEKAAIAEDIADLWKEIKSKGYDVKLLRKAHSISKIKVEDRRVLGTYVDALGLFE